MGTAFAVPKGKMLEFKHTKDGSKITFSGDIHAAAGLKCNDCHGKVFPSVGDAVKDVKANGGPMKIKMDDIFAGKYCGTCHNGTMAFAAAKDKKENCIKCHKM
ncbi:MAG: cytochrome C [Nitrospirae bacterium]|nr:cytochrome C [Nitrospirota bacterium]